MRIETKSHVAKQGIMIAATPEYRERLRALKCIVIIPTYNNAGTLEQVIADVQRYADQVLVVNDGSTDATAQLLAARSDIRVIGYEQNRGKGYALKCGLKAADEAGFRYALTIDADGQHYADDIPRFIDRIKQAPDTLLIGARNLAADNMPSKNTFANRFSNFWYRVETGHTLTDTQSGYRLYPLQRLRKIGFITSRYEFEVEIIVRAAWRGIAVENVPIRVYYPPAEERVSHFRPLQDFTRISLLNTVLVSYALLFYYPWRFVRLLTWENIRTFFRTQIFHTSESNVRMAAAMGWGIFCGIIPLWGYQMIFAGITAHLMRLNKVVAIVFSNISIPPMIPLILYASMLLGAEICGVKFRLTLHDISFERIAESLLQYAVGSVALAIAAGIVVFVGSWLMLTICKREAHHE